MYVHVDCFKSQVTPKSCNLSFHNRCFGDVFANPGSPQLGDSRIHIKRRRNKDFRKIHCRLFDSAVFLSWKTSARTFACACQWFQIKAANPKLIRMCLVKIVISIIVCESWGLPNWGGPQDSPNRRRKRNRPYVPSPGRARPGRVRDMPHLASRRPTRTTFSSRTSSPASAPPLCSSTSSPGCSSCRRLRTSSSQTSYSRREGGPEVCAGPEYADAPERRGRGEPRPVSSLCGRWSDLTVCGAACGFLRLYTDTGMTRDL